MPARTSLSPEILSEHLNYLKLPVMRTHFAEIAHEAAQTGQTHLEFLGKLVEKEVISKKERAARSRTAAAQLPVIKTMDTWDWTWNAAYIKREQIMPLFSLEFVRRKNNLILLGKQGLGKTHIDLALAYTACANGIHTRFTTAADMLNRLHAALADHSLDKALQIYTRPTLLVIDEVGYLPFSKEAGDLFFQVVAKRYERGSIVLGCNRAFKQWSEIFADSIVAAAIIERLVHHGDVLTLKGLSLRAVSFKLEHRAQLGRELLRAQVDHRAVHGPEQGDRLQPGLLQSSAKVTRDVRV
jgi:DNA replication protein DnaC